jgi:NAD(P)H dehydrogenase (quinone)
MPNIQAKKSLLYTLSTLAHYCIIYVPLDYKNTFPLFSDLNTVRGETSWGAGVLTGANGSRQPTDVEPQIAELQRRIIL